MDRAFSRRAALRAGAGAAIAAAAPLAAAAAADDDGAISAEDAARALATGEIVLVDVRTPQEWADTGVAEGAWPIDLQGPEFQRRLVDALALAGDRPVALICATGVRSGYVHAALRRAGIMRTLDVESGMMGPEDGWFALDLPTQTADAAIAAMPPALAP